MPPDGLVQEFLAFFLEELQVLEENLARLEAPAGWEVLWTQGDDQGRRAGTAALPAPWMAQPGPDWCGREPGLRGRAVGALRETAKAVGELLKVVTGDFQPDPRRGEGRELAQAHQAVFRAKLALDVLELEAEKCQRRRQKSS